MKKKIAPQPNRFSKQPSIISAIVLQIAAGVGLVAGSLYVFLTLAEKVLKNPVNSFDESIIQIVYAWRSPALTEFMSSVTILGSHVFLGLAMSAVILYLWKTQRQNAILFTFILTFGIGLNFLLKLMFHRPRPDLMPLIYEPSYSFPSGHAMNSFIFFACISFFVFRHFKLKTLGWIHIAASGVIVLLIGLSRIYLGVHYPSDVLAGYAAGLLWFILVLLFQKSITFIKLIRQ